MSKLWKDILPQNIRVENNSICWKNIASSKLVSINDRKISYSESFAVLSPSPVYQPVMCEAYTYLELTVLIINQASRSAT